MDIAVNAWFWDQPATGSGQYVRHLLPALAALEPNCRFHVVVPRGTDIQCSAPNMLLQRASDLGPFGQAQGRPFGQAQGRPFGQAQGRPFGQAQGRPFGQAQGRPFGQAQGRLQTSDFYKLWFEQVVFPRTSARRKAGVAHVPYFASPVWPSTPTVVTVHDLIPVVLPAYRGSALVRAYTQLVAAGARRADVIITDSESSRQDIVAHLKIESQRVHVIPLAASPWFQPGAPEDIERVHAHYRLPDHYVLYLGGFDQRKNVTGLLQAFARLKHKGHVLTGLGLVIAGRLPAVDTDFTPNPRRIVAQLGLEESVAFPGWIDEADKPALYSGAELFVFPSVYEGFGLPVLEAMACGAAVVTSNTSSLPEVVGEAGLTVSPSDPDALAQAMAAVLGDEARRQAMRQASLVRASSFNWERTAQATLTVLEQLQVAS